MQAPRNYERVEGADGEESSADNEESSASLAESRSHSRRRVGMFSKREQPYSVLKDAEDTTSNDGEEGDVKLKSENRSIEVEMARLDGDTGDTVPRLDSSCPSSTISMTIRVLSLSGEKHSIAVVKNTTVEELKTKVAEATGVEKDLQRLIFMGVAMKDSKSLNDYKIEDGVVVHLFERRKRHPNARHGEANPDSSLASENEGIISAGVTSGHSPVPGIAVDASGLFAEPHIQNLRRTIKLWSIFILLIHTMQLFILLLGSSDGENREESREQSSVEASQAQLIAHMPHFGLEVLNIMRIVVIFTGIAVGIKGLQGTERMDLRTLWIFSRGILTLSVVYIAWLVLSSVLQYMAIKKMRREGIEDNDFIGPDEHFFVSVAFNFLLVASIFLYCILKSFQFHNAVQAAVQASHRNAHAVV